MHSLAACCDRARWLTSGIQGVFPLVVLRFVRGSQNPGRDICPCPVIQGLLLTPQNISIRVLVKVGGYQIVGERGELFDPADHNIVDALVLTLLDEGVIDLTSAKDVPSDLVGRYQVVRVRIRDIPQERGVSRHLL